MNTDEEKLLAALASIAVYPRLFPLAPEQTEGVDAEIAY